MMKTTSDPLIGQRWAERFLVKRLLGAGGMGRVYLAWREELKRPVALKVLRPELASDERRRQRFEREARAASSVNHPGLATIYDFGCWRNQLYLAMEYLEGTSLEALLAQEKRLPSERVAQIGLQACAALDAVHRENVLHRDLKPGNVMLLPNADGGPEQVKLVDFGLALIKGDDNPRLTREGLVTGTPGYMSPEQCRGKKLDPRSDLYALGILLYEALCGRLPFWAPAPAALIVKQIFQDPEPPSDRAPGANIHPALEALVLRLLHRDPEHRPADAAAAAALLEVVREQMASGDPGASPLPAPPAPAELARHSGQHVLSVEPDRPFTESLTALLRFHGYEVSRTEELDRLASDPDFDVAVVDLRDDAEELLTRLEQMELPACPLLAVGPDDDVDQMTRALQLGLYLYVPATQVGGRLPRALKKALRRAKKS